MHRQASVNVIRRIQRHRYDAALRRLSASSTVGRTLLVGRGSSHAFGRFADWLSVASTTVIETDSMLARSARAFYPELMLLEASVAAGVAQAMSEGAIARVIAVDAIEVGDDAASVMAALAAVGAKVLVVAQRPLEVLAGRAVGAGSHRRWAHWLTDAAGVRGRNFRHTRVYPWTLIRLNGPAGGSRDGR